MQTAFTIRDATSADIAAITAIYAHSVLHETASFELEPPGEAEMAARFAAITGAGYPYVVAVEGDGTVAAYAYASAYRARPAYRWTVENSVYVRNDRRSAGLGAALTAEIVERCAGLGFRQIIAVIGGSQHEASIRMHEKLGFARVGILPATGFKHGCWLDSVLMQMALGDGPNTDPDPDSYPGTLWRPASSTRK